MILKTEKPRRNRGEGGLRKRKDGIWEAYVSNGIKDNGKRDRKYVYGKTKAECVAKLNELKKIDFSTKSYKDASKVSFSNWADHCIEIRTRKIADTTKSDYIRILDKHVKPFIGSVMLDQITDKHIERRICEMQEAGSGLRTQEYAYFVINYVLNIAVTKEIILRNPCLKVEKPKPKIKNEYIPDPKEVRKIIECAYPKYKLFFETAWETGMRRGEVLALDCRVIDRKNQSIRVEASAYSKDNEVLLKAPKNNSSKRNVLVSQVFIDKLINNPPRIAGHIFVDQNGRLFNPNGISKAFTTAVKRAGLDKKGIRLHSLRHAHAHALLKEGVPLVTVSKRLGHSDIKITVERYGHITDDFQNDVPAIMDGLRNAL